MLGRRIPALAVTLLVAVLAGAPGTAAAISTSSPFLYSIQSCRAAAAMGKKGHVTPCQLAPTGTTLRPNLQGSCTLERNSSTCHAASRPLESLMPLCSGVHEPCTEICRANQGIKQKPLLWSGSSVHGSKSTDMHNVMRCTPQAAPRSTPSSSRARRCGARACRRPTSARVRT